MLAAMRQRECCCCCWRCCFLLAWSLSPRRRRRRTYNKHTQLLEGKQQERRGEQTEETPGEGEGEGRQHECVGKRAEREARAEMALREKTIRINGTDSTDSTEGDSFFSIRLSWPAQASSAVAASRHSIDHNIPLSASF